MKVFLTGGTGQVGRALIASKPEWVELFAPGRGELELTDTTALCGALDAFRPDRIINAAAYTAVDRAEADEVGARAVNADMVRHLADWLDPCRGDAGLIQISTDFVFDGAASTPYRPDAPTSPPGVYGRTKLEGERAARTTAFSTTIRTAWVYAAEGANFVHTMLRLMASRDEVRVVADQIGTPTHATSLAHALWLLAIGGHRGLYHWTDAGVASWYDFAVAIQEEALTLGLLERAVPVVPIRTEDYPTPARRPAYSVLDKSATWAITGPARHWRVELRDCLAEIARGRANSNS